MRGKAFGSEESVTGIRSFWMLVHEELQLPQAEGLSWYVEGASESGAIVTSE